MAENNRNNVDDDVFKIHLIHEEINKKDSKKNSSYWIDNIIKIVGPLLTIGGLLIGVWQFSKQQSVNDQMEFKRRIWERQLDACNEIGDITSKIVTEKNKVSFDSLSRKFDQLYWGKLPLFQDTLVQSSLKEFGEILEDYRNGAIDINSPSLLKKAGYRLVNNCQNAIRLSWHELNKE